MDTAGYARDYQPAIEHLEKEFARIARTLAPEVVAQLRKNISFAPQFDRATQPDRIIVVWNYQSESGMPSVNERESMDRLEDALAPSIESDGFATLALVSTGENSREWIYYTRSEDEFMDRLNAALKGAPAYPIEIHAAPDPAWSTYHEFLSGLSGGHG